VRHIDEKHHSSPQASRNADYCRHELHEEGGRFWNPDERKQIAADRFPDAERQWDDHDQRHERDEDEKIHNFVRRQDAERGGGKNMDRYAKTLDDKRENPDPQYQREVIDIEPGHGDEVGDELPFWKTKFVEDDKE